MLDFSLPYYGVLMLREHPEETLPAALPQGFSFCGWKPGMETEWAKLMARTEMMESFEKGLSYFREEFLSHPEELPANMLFVRSLEGEIIGTASLWKGACFGEPRYRIHWVAVDGRYEGRGIGKAMLARLCAQWDGLHCPKPLYLATQTWSWQAISLYARFGFRPYLDKAVQGPIITSFFYPAGSAFTFEEMYDYIKARGYVLYPGKVMEADTFRVGNIGEIYAEDIEKLAAIMADFLKEAGRWAS